METLRRHSTANNSVLKIIVTVLFIALPFVGFYWGMQYQSLMTPVSEPPTPIVRRPTPTPKQPIVIIPADWKTYKRKEEGFEFKYPPNWSVFDSGGLLIYDRTIDDPSHPDNVLDIGMKGGLLPDNVTSNDPVGIKKYSPVNNKIYEEKIANINLGGKPAVKAKVVVLPDSETNGVSGIVVRVLMDGTADDRIFSLQLRYVSNINTPQDLDKYFDQILSTFKFIDNELTGSYKNPAWVDDLTKKQESEPVANPPAYLSQCNYRNQRVYYLPARCCDIASYVYNDKGDVICSPDGGFTGKGDSKCSDFFDTRKNCIVVWKDARNYP